MTDSCAGPAGLPIPISDDDSDSTSSFYTGGRLTKRARDFQGHEPMPSLRKPVLPEFMSEAVTFPDFREHYGEFLDCSTCVKLRGHIWKYTTATHTPSVYMVEDPRRIYKTKMCHIDGKVQRAVMVPIDQGETVPSTPPPEPCPAK